MISAFIYLFCRSLSEIAGNKQAEGVWMVRFPPPSGRHLCGKGAEAERQGGRGGGWGGQGNDPSVEDWWFSEWRNYSPPCVVQLEWWYPEEKKKVRAHITHSEYTVTFTLYVYVMCIIVYRLRQMHPEASSSHGAAQWALSGDLSKLTFLTWIY